MHCTTKNNILCLNYEFDAIKLTVVAGYEYLGVIISSDLELNKHVNFIKEKGNQKLRNVCRKHVHHLLRLHFWLIKPS